MNTRQTRIARSMGLLVGAAAAVGGVSGVLLRDGHWPMAAMLATVVALFGVACAATLPYWRSIDDAAREAHKTAWYWGGGTGAGAGLLAAMAIGGATGPMARGALLTVGVAAAGYAVVWAAWWLARRPAHRA